MRSRTRTELRLAPQALRYDTAERDPVLAARQLVLRSVAAVARYRARETAGIPLERSRPRRVLVLARFRARHRRAGDLCRTARTEDAPHRGSACRCCEDRPGSHSAA